MVERHSVQNPDDEILAQQRTQAAEDLHDVNETLADGLTEVDPAKEPGRAFFQDQVRGLIKNAGHSRPKD